MSRGIEDLDIVSCIDFATALSVRPVHKLRLMSLTLFDKQFKVNRAVRFPQAEGFEAITRRRLQRMWSADERMRREAKILVASARAPACVVVGKFEVP